ncbi:MAG: protein-export chaperone SecB [Bacteroidota bacterium]
MIEKATSSIRLESIFLSETIFNRGNDLEKDSIDDYGMQVGLNSIDRDDVIQTTVTVELGKNSNPNAFYMKVAMVGIFRKKGETPLTDNEFKNVNAPAIIYPYIRQHIRSLSLDATIKPILLPLVNFQKLYEHNKKRNVNTKS